MCHKWHCFWSLGGTLRLTASTQYTNHGLIYYRLCFVKICSQYIASNTKRSAITKLFGSRCHKHIRKIPLHSAGQFIIWTSVLRPTPLQVVQHTPRQRLACSRFTAASFFQIPKNKFFAYNTDCSGFMFFCFVAKLQLVKNDLRLISTLEKFTSTDPWNWLPYTNRHLT